MILHFFTIGVMRNTLGTYTPNYNLYMPSIGEQGWGELVSNNFEILDTNLNNLQNQINTINTNIGDGTRILTLTGNAYDFQQYWEDNVYITYIYGNYTMTENITPPSSARLCLIICNGNLNITGSLDTYPTSLRSETPPNSPSNNVYNKTISTSYSDTITLPYTKTNNSAVIEFSKTGLKSFLDAIYYTSVNYTLSIPAATAAGGHGIIGDGAAGTAGTAENTCNGGGGGGYYTDGGYTGGTGCIFGQYAGGNNSNGYGYGSSASNKYRCGLVIIALGNLTINSTITQIGGNYSGNTGGYGGGASTSGGGGGAPVFIYYTGTYINNGTINTAGGRGSYSNTNGGAGGIKTTKITI